MHFAILNFALREGGFSLISCSDAIIGFLFTSSKIGGGQVHIIWFFSQWQRVEWYLKTCFTTLSSSEWKLITLIIAPNSNKSNTSFNVFLTFCNSWFTSIRIAWNTLVAGCIEVLILGVAFSIISANSVVVFILFCFLLPSLRHLCSTIGIDGSCCCFIYFFLPNGISIFTDAVSNLTGDFCCRL